MHSLRELLDLSDAQKKEIGAVFTPAEIFGQPKVWEKTATILQSQNSEIRAFMDRTGVLSMPDSSTTVTGAGTSEFVGNSISSMLQGSLGTPVRSVSTTDFILRPDYYLLKKHNNLVISIARSGDSPESMATFRKAKIADQGVWQLAITCNRDGRLADEARRDDRSFLLLLPDESNDRGLAMTSSFSSMVLALVSLAYLEKNKTFMELASIASLGARRILEKEADTVKEFIEATAMRVLYLGSCELKGCAEEAHLKIMEMTDGKIVSDFNSYVGLRHGPQVFADDSALVIAFISGNKEIQRYELDLLREMQAKKQGKDYLFVCEMATQEIRSLKGRIIEILPDAQERLPDYMRVLTDIVVGQLAGLFKSLQLGLKPDAPSESGTISRVVKGIVIYGDGYNN